MEYFRERTFLQQMIYSIESHNIAMQLRYSEYETNVYIKTKRTTEQLLKNTKETISRSEKRSIRSLRKKDKQQVYQHRYTYKRIYKLQIL